MMTAFDLAQRFVGVEEIKGAMDNHQIMAMLRLDADWPEHDEVPWCSAFVNYICWLLRLPRSKSLLARSWLRIGTVININKAEPKYDIVILDRTGGQDRTSFTAKGHVGFYAGYDVDFVYLLGGNQDNCINVAKYNIDDVLGVRRLEV